MGIRNLELPPIIAELINSQNQHDSAAFVACFKDQAEVFDEGKHHKGSKEIKAWNEQTNSEYNTQNEPISFEHTDAGDVLTLKVSGNFKGSPIQLKYTMSINDNLISYLSIGS